MESKAWRVRKAEVLPLRSALIQPFRTALGDHNTLNNFLFVIYPGKGQSPSGDSPRSLSAYAGEAAVATHITGETHEGTRAALESAGQWLIGKDIRNVRRLSSALRERIGQYPSAIAAVETALFDALASSRGIALWKMFGRRCHMLKSDITIVVADMPETEASARKFYRKGFRAFKIKVGRDFDLDVRRVAAVAKLAPRADLYLDANQGFSARVMMRFLKEIERLGVRPALLEQPVPRDDFEGLKKIARSTNIPVCADESVRSAAEARRIVKHKAAGVINIKLMKFGMVEALKVAAIARKGGAGLMIGGMLESSVAMTAAAHLAAGLGGFPYVDLDTPFFIRGEVSRNPFLSTNGTYDLRACRRGIGIDWQKGRRA